MFWKATLTQTKFMLKQKSAVFTFYALLLIVLLNFLENVLNFQYRDVIAMYHPMKLLTLSYNKSYYRADLLLFFVQFYSLAVVCPAGFSMAREEGTRQNVFMAARLGPSVYQWSKLAASFLATFLVFTVPFFIEILLNCISFPLQATGDMMNMGMLDPGYIDGIRRYLFSGLYRINPYFYSVVGILFFGVVSGLLGSLTVAFSALVRVRLRVFLFLPVYLLLNATVIIHSFLRGIPVSLRWYNYLMLFDDSPKSVPAFIAALFSIVLLTVIMNVLSLKRGRIY